MTRISGICNRVPVTIFPVRADRTCFTPHTNSSDVPGGDTVNAGFQNLVFEKYRVIYPASGPGSTSKKTDPGVHPAHPLQYFGTMQLHPLTNDNENGINSAAFLKLDRVGEGLK